MLFYSIFKSSKGTSAHVQLDNNYHLRKGDIHYEQQRNDSRIGRLIYRRRSLRCETPEEEQMLIWVKEQMNIFEWENGRLNNLL